MKPGTREIVDDITIYPNYVGEPWGARLELRVWKDDGMADYGEYEANGDSPESALAALKEAVKEGEEGWTW